MFTKFRYLQLLSAPQADKFLSFKMDPLPIYIIHNKTKLKTSDKDCSLQKVTLQNQFQVKTILPARFYLLCSS